MKINIKEVLAMPEEKFIEWLHINLPDYGYNDIGCCLDVLAFRMRFLAEWPNLASGMRQVYDVWCKTTWKARKKSGETKKHIKYTKFLMKISGPKLWILAAMLALKAMEGE